MKTNTLILLGLAAAGGAYLWIKKSGSLAYANTPPATASVRFYPLMGAMFAANYGQLGIKTRPGESFSLQGKTWQLGNDESGLIATQLT